MLVFEIRSRREMFYFYERISLEKFKTDSWFIKKKNQVFQLKPKYSNQKHLWQLERSLDEKERITTTTTVIEFQKWLLKISLSVILSWHLLSKCFTTNSNVFIPLVRKEPLPLARPQFFS